MKWQSCSIPIWYMIPSAKFQNVDTWIWIERSQASQAIGKSLEFACPLGILVLALVCQAYYRVEVHWYIRNTLLIREKATEQRRSRILVNAAASASVTIANSDPRLPSETRFKSEKKKKTKRYIKNLLTVEQYFVKASTTWWRTAAGEKDLLDQQKSTRLRYCNGNVL